jgi:hypothetical protein
MHIGTAVWWIVELFGFAYLFLSCGWLTYQIIRNGLGTGGGLE